MKSNQKSSHQKCFFAAQGLCPAKQAEPRTAIILRYFVPSFPTLQQKLAMSLQPHKPPLFCPLSLEAVLLGRKFNNSIIKNRPKLFC
jgi:hypothetical protein